MYAGVPWKHVVLREADRPRLHHVGRRLGDSEIQDLHEVVFATVPAHETDSPA